VTRIQGDWLTARPVQQVLGLLSGGGHSALLVGGCVRNALLGVPVTDLDIATDARPLRVLELASKAGLKAVPTGIDHGTVTVIADGHPHEITTFRRDVKTDGRRAEVAFPASLAEDAARRDFTINALYADAEGNVTDPLDGLPDLRARRIVFVGDPEARIREDYLRILRFFRFFAVFGGPGAAPDAEGLAACGRLAPELGRISKERIGQEMRKLLNAGDPIPALAAMDESGVLAQVLGKSEVAVAARLLALEGGHPSGWIARLAALGASGEAGALRLSRDEAGALAVLKTEASGARGAGELGYRHGAETARRILLLRAAQSGGTLPSTWLDEATHGAAARFPVSAGDLMPRHAGAELGQRLKALEDRWIASGFALSREQLLA
jgi:poly(A) polymerase